MVEIIDGGITTPQGFKAAGVHSGVKYRSLDLGMLYSEVPARAYCAFTSNNVKAAPVQVMMEENSKTRHCRRWLSTAETPTRSPDAAA